MSTTITKSIQLTTTGTSGAATLVGSTLNIPQYSGGGASGIHNLMNQGTGIVINAQITTSALSTTAQVANRMVFYPFIPANTFTCSNLFINVFSAVAGANAKILIYSNVNGNPSSLLYESANLDCSTTGVKTATTSFTFNAGTIYWFAYWGNTTPQVYTMPATNMYMIRVNGISPSSMLLAAYTFGAAPDPVVATTTSNQAVPFIGITIA